MVGVVIVCRSVRRWVRGNVVWCVVRVVRTVVLVTVWTRTSVLVKSKVLVTTEAVGTVTVSFTICWSKGETQMVMIFYCGLCHH